MFLSWKTCLFCPLEGGILSSKIPTSSSGTVGGGILVEYKRGLAGNRDSKFQEMKSLDVTDCNQYSWNGPPAC